ncbi:MAG: nucleotidyltransferase family protein [Actinomycetota bacterium]
MERDYGVIMLGIFGSYARGNQREGSDLDLLVKFNAPIGLIRFIKLENELSDLLGVKVDLVVRDALKPRIGERILQELLPS